MYSAIECEPPLTKSRKASYDDDREQIWNLLFGNEPMPSVKDNAVETNYGILDREIKEHLTEAELKKIFGEARDKYSD